MPNNRTDEPSFDDIQNSLDQHTRQLAEKLATEHWPKPLVVLSHFVMLSKDTLEKGQFLRRSGIWISREVGNRLKLLSSDESRLQDDQSDWDEKHSHAHAQFIAYLDRDNTFLDYLVRKIDTKHCYDKPVVLLFEFRGEAGTSLPSGQLVEDSVFQIDDALAERVCPKTSAELFVEDIYRQQGEASHRTNWNQFFYMRRVLASYELHCAEAMGGTDTTEETSRESLEIGAWQRQIAELSGIQSALSYMGTLATFGARARAFSIVVSIRELAELNAEVKSLSIEMISFKAEDDDALRQERYSQLAKFLRTTRALSTPDEGNYVANLRILESSCSCGDLSFNSMGQQNFVGLNELQNQIGSIYSGDRFKEQIEIHGISGLLLLQRILGELHERQRLDFFFVCGERSVFSDKAIFRQFSTDERALFDELKVSTIKSFEVARAQFSRAAEQIAREHYPWFEGGRHALFWDSTSRDGRPSGLVKLKEGNWKQIALARYYLSSPLRIPECLFLYSLGTEDFAGMLHLKPNARAREMMLKGARDETKIASIVSWHRGRWCFNSDSAVALKDHLDKKFPESEGAEWIEKLSSIVARIASDEQRGGTIIVANGSCEQTPFKVMGKSLGVQPTGFDPDDIVDRLKLISHDGASIVCIQDGRLGNWQHRRYLSPGDEERQALDALVALLDNSRTSPMASGHNGRINAAHHPLRWKGTRRWAAAASAFNPNVKLSVVVSQDGDIQVWHVRDAASGGTQRTVHVFEITKTGVKPNEYEHTYDLKPRSDISIGL